MPKKEASVLSDDRRDDVRDGAIVEHVETSNFKECTHWCQPIETILTSIVI